MSAKQSYRRNEITSLLLFKKETFYACNKALALHNIVWLQLLSKVIGACIYDTPTPSIALPYSEAQRCKLPLHGNMHANVLVTQCM